MMWIKVGSLSQNENDINIFSITFIKIWTENGLKK